MENQVFLDSLIRKKMSPSFAKHLELLRSEQKVRAIVLLQTGRTDKPNHRRQNLRERKAVVNEIKTTAKQTLRDIDDILDNYGGKRISKGANALGSIFIESTVVGVIELAKSNSVKAILEDQAIRSVY